MSRKIKTIPFRFLIILFTAVAFLSFSYRMVGPDIKIVSYIADPDKENIELYWKDDKGDIFRSLGKLRQVVEGKNRQLVFAMNGGMYLKDNSPQGLFIQNSEVVKKMDTGSGSGNFHLKPNGIFYITTSETAVVCQTSE